MNTVLRGTTILLSLCLAGCADTTGPDAFFPTSAMGINTAALSSDSRSAIIAAVEHGGALWDVNSAGRLFDWNHVDAGYTSIATAAFSPASNYAVTANAIDMVLWDVQSGESLAYWQSPGEVLDIALNRGADRALLGLTNGQAVLFDVRNGGILQTLNHQARVRSLAMDPDAQLAVTGADDYVARVWDIATGRLLSERHYDNNIDTVALSENQQLVFSSASLSSAQIWDARSGELISSISGDEWLWTRRVSYLAARFSEDGSELVTGSASGLVQLWDVRSGAELQRWRVKTLGRYGPVQASVYAVAFGPGRQITAIGSNGLVNRFER